VILVTGASSGIGYTVVRDLVKRGEKVLASVRKPADSERLLAELGPENLKTVLMDLARPIDIEVLKNRLTEFEKEGLFLKALVNNAGVVVAGPMEFVSIDRVKELFEINVFGLMRLTQVCLPFLRRTKGRVVNISSIAGRTVTPILAPYCASKHVVEVISDALRIELTGSGVHVVLIEPGSIKTPIWEKSLTSNVFDFDQAPAQAREFYGEVLEKFVKLAKKLGESGSSPEKVSDAVMKALFLKRPATRYLVGLDAKLSIWQNILPDRIRDKMFISYFASKSL
jgi:short-subunit dehydrogenase